MAFNVLVVDDSAVMRQMVVRTLKMSGLPLGTVLEAANGEEGLSVLQEQWVDLLLLDINMPVMNGEEMLRRLRASPETEALPVIVTLLPEQICLSAPALAVGLGFTVTITASVPAQPLLSVTVSV